MSALSLGQHPRRVLPDRAEDEIARIRYASLKQQVLCLDLIEPADARAVGRATGRRRRSKAAVVPLESLSRVRKRRSSTEDVWFTTLASLKAQAVDAVQPDGGSVEVPSLTSNGLEDALFARFLTEMEDER